jgi:hypothetical protein
MSAPSTTEQRQRPRLAARFAVIAPLGIRSATVLLAAIFLLTLALAPRAEAFVYWANHPGGPHQGIGRANLDGTGVDRSFIRLGPADEPMGVAVDDDHVYWTSFESLSTGTGTIGRANLDGTGVDRSFMTDAEVPLGVAVDSAHVYWADFGGGTIGRANLDGTGVDHSFISGFAPTGVAVDSAHIYWARPPEGTGFPCAGTYPAKIGRANLDGTGADPTFIAGPCDFPTQVAINDAHVYWSNFFDETIARANLDGSGDDQRFITPKEAGFSQLRGVAVDAAHIYWTGQGVVGRANLNGTGFDRSFIDSRRGLYPENVAVDALRSFSFGTAKRNKSKGTAKLTVKVPGPGELELANTTEVKGAKKRAEAKGKEKLPVKPRGTAKQKLNRKGKAKVKAEVTYSPQGGHPNIVGNTDTKTVKLVKRD